MIYEFKLKTSSPYWKTSKKQKRLIPGKHVVLVRNCLNSDKKFDIHPKSPHGPLAAKGMGPQSDPSSIGGISRFLDLGAACPLPMPQSSSKR